MQPHLLLASFTCCCLDVRFFLCGYMVFLILTAMMHGLYIVVAATNTFDPWPCCNVGSQLQLAR